jgi:hypothetical protein
VAALSADTGNAAFTGTWANLLSHYFCCMGLL